jgi:hypothetical protein
MLLLLLVMILMAQFKDGMHCITQRYLCTANSAAICVTFTLHRDVTLLLSQQRIDQLLKSKSDAVGGASLQERLQQV